MEAVQSAQLAFLTIYNPTLGPTDETVDDQIVYHYASKSSRTRQDIQASQSRTEEQLLQEERNERLRQVGLAQGMVGFARAFSNDEPVDYIESEKARSLIHEIEPGWWMLAVRTCSSVRSISNCPSCSLLI